MAELELIAVRLPRESLTSPKCATQAMEDAIRMAGLNEAELHLLDYALASGRSVVARLLDEIRVKRARILHEADLARKAAIRHERSVKAAATKSRAVPAPPIPLDKLFDGLG